MNTKPYTLSLKDTEPFSLEYKILLADEINKRFENFEVELYIKQQNTKQTFVKTIPATEETYETKQYNIEPVEGFHYGPYHSKGNKTKINISAKVLALYVIKAEIEISFYKYTGKFMVHLNLSESPSDIFYNIINESQKLVNKILIDNKEFEFIDNKHIEHYNGLDKYQKIFFNKNILMSFNQ